MLAGAMYEGMACGQNISDQPVAAASMCGELELTWGEEIFALECPFFDCQVLLSTCVGRRPVQGDESGTLFIQSVLLFF